MKKIPVTGGKFVKVDNEDFRFLSKFVWSRNRHEKVRTQFWGEDQKGTSIGLYKFILGSTSKSVFFKNGDIFDYRKKNLEMTSRSHLIHYGKKAKGCSSKYKGVSFKKEKKKWEVHLYDKNKMSKRAYLGMFDDEKLAAKVYNKKAREIYGDFAYQNKI